MLRKKNFLVMFVCVFGAFSLSAQELTNANAKKTIKTIWTVYQTWQNRSRGFIEPAEYIKEKGTDKIIGRKFLSYTPRSNYMTITLKSNAGKITEAEFIGGSGGPKVELDWTNGRISRVKIAYLYNCEYKIEYDANGNISKLDQGKPGKYNLWAEVEFDGDKISKVISYASKSKKPTIESIVEYKYDANKTTLTGKKYKLGKSATPKNMTSEASTVYTKKSTNHLVLESKIRGKVEYVFNSDGELEKEIEDRNGIREEETNFYKDGKRFKTETIITKNGEYTGKEISILFSLENQPSTAPVFDWKKGHYKFNEINDLIFESNGTKYRKKINGVWGPWKFHEY